MIRVHEYKFGNLNRTVVTYEFAARTDSHKQIFIKMIYQNQRKLAEKVLQYEINICGSISVKCFWIAILNNSKSYLKVPRKTNMKTSQNFRVKVDVGIHLSKVSLTTLLLCKKYITQYVFRRLFITFTNQLLLKALVNSYF